MTQAETTRGRGRPKTFDEDELLARIHSIEDLHKVRAALEANGEGLTAKNTVAWLAARRAGDPTGGVSLMSASRYRAALARLDEIPLPPVPKRRRIATRKQSGNAHLALVASAAAGGAMVLASLTGPEILNLALSFASRAIADNAPVEITGHVAPLPVAA